MRMKGRNVVVFVFSFALAAAVLAQAAKSVEGTGARAPAPMPAADLKWTDLDPNGAPGVKVADLWGDHQKGAFGAFFRLPAGFAVPLHTHTHDMKVVTVSGTYIQGPDGKPEFRLGPGSYLMQPGGNYRHTTSCDPASECLFFVESDGPFDLQPVVTGNAATPK
jgi:anti-sigma factor ChrR (cupin superfamily)